MKRTSLSQIQLLISLILHSKTRKVRFTNFCTLIHLKVSAQTKTTKVFSSLKRLLCTQLPNF